MKYLTNPTLLGTVLLVVMVIVGGYIIAIGQDIPEILTQVFLMLLAFVFGVQVPNKPLHKDDNQ